MDDKNNIGPPDDPEKLPPAFSKLEKGNDFGVPGDYFDSLADRIMDTCADAEELKAIAPVLSEIPRYNPFEVPAGYFDQLPIRIQERCAEKPDLSWGAWLMQVLRTRYAIPALAGVILIIVAASILFKDNTITPAENIAAYTDTIEPIHSADEQANDLADVYAIDESVLVESLETGSIAEDAAEEISREDLENYIADNNIDVAELINEL